MKKILLLMLLLSPTVWAQGIRYDNTARPVGTGGLPPIVSLPGASIHWCSYPANAVPCTNYATTYTSRALATTCPSSTPLVLAGTATCVAAADSNGNFGVWASCGAYAYTITVGGASTGPYPAMLDPVESPCNSSGTPTTYQQAFYITGDGNNDNSAVINNDIDACAAGNTCTFYLSNTVIKNTINVLSTSEFRFISGAGVTTCAAATACFERTGGSPTVPVPYRWSFSGFTFVNCGSPCTVNAPIIYDNLTFASGGNQGITLDNDTFDLTIAGTTGWEGTGSDFNVFNNDTWQLCTNCIALEPTGQSGNDGPQTSEVTNNNFRQGIAVAPPSTNCSSGWQGWTFTANQFFASKVNAVCGNTIFFIGNQFVSSYFVADSLYGIRIEGNYFDGPGGTSSDPNSLLTVENTYHDTVAVAIEDNFFQQNGQTYLNGIAFENGGNTTNTVTITGNTYEGTSNSCTAPDYGVVFNDPNLSSVYLGGDHYLQECSALDFTAHLTHSTFDRFEAASVSYYALGIPTYVIGPGISGSNVADPWYQVFYGVHLTGYLPATVASAETITSSLLSGYKLNRFNWLPESYKSKSESIC